MREHPVFKFWSAVNNLGKIQKEGQSAGNFLLKGSSETTCEAIYINDKFKWWFIGFTEGKGSFNLINNGELEFKITHCSKDAQILFYIKKELGFGSVSVLDKTNKIHQYVVRDKKNIIKLINIFNGNLITKQKIKQFKFWVERFNITYNTKEVEYVIYLESKCKVSLDNGWLSGFTDGVSNGYQNDCFTSSILTSKSGKDVVIVRYVIFKEDDKEFSQDVANLINGYLIHLKDLNGYISVVNINKLSKIINYFKHYPLKSKKLITYRRWLKIYNLVIKTNPLEDFKVINSLIKKLSLIIK